jgi:hypothetical protein
MTDKYKLQKELQKIEEEIEKKQKTHEELKRSTKQLRDQYESQKASDEPGLSEEMLENINNQIISNSGKSGELILAITGLEKRSSTILESLNKFVEPTCSGCGNSGNIFEYRGVPAQIQSLNPKVIADGDLPKNKLFIIYCIKCGKIVGTAGKI